MFSGEKCNLRPLALNDYKYLNVWNQNCETMKYLGGGYMPVSIDLQQKWIEKMIDTSGSSVNKRYMITDKGNRPIGLIGLYQINWIHRTCEIGIYVGEEKDQGRGIAQEAVEMLEKFAKDFLNLRKIKLYVVKENEKALNFWKKCNYQQVGKLNRERYIEGRYLDLIIMEKFL